MSDGRDSNLRFLILNNEAMAIYVVSFIQAYLVLSTQTQCATAFCQCPVLMGLNKAKTPFNVSATS